MLTIQLAIQQHRTEFLFEGQTVKLKSGAPPPSFPDRSLGLERIEAEGSPQHRNVALIQGLCCGNVYEPATIPGTIIPHF